MVYRVVGLGHAGKVRRPTLRGRVLAVAAALVGVAAVTAAGVGAATLLTSTAQTTQPWAGCGCSTFGEYTDPDEGTAPAVTQTGTSPHGTYTLTTSGDPSSPTLTVSKDGSTVITKTGTAWGFSPDDDRFVIWTASEVSLYDLAGSNPSTAIWNAPDPDPTRLRFSSSGKWVFYSYISTGQVHLLMVSAQTGGETTIGAFAPAGTGSDGSSFGTSNWGFSPDDKAFVYGDVSGQSTVDWTLVSLGSTPTIVKRLTNIPIVSGFWQFSPCGDAIGLAYQADQNNVAIDLFSTADGSELGNVGPPFANNSDITFESSQADDAEIALYEGQTYKLLDDGCNVGGTTSTTTGSTSTGTTTIASPPTASFTLPTNAIAGKSLTFTDTSTASSGSIAAWAWDFGDGSRSSDESPAHAYTSAAGGTFTVKLTVTDSNGGSDTATQSLTVAANSPPVAQFTAGAVLRGHPLTLTSTSTDPDGPADIVEQDWQVADHQTGDLIQQGSGDSLTIDKLCEPVDVTLTVFDTVGNSDSAEQPYTVSTTAQAFTVSPGGSIADALATACPGDTAKLEAGTYEGGFSLDGVNLAGAGMGASIIDGSGGQDGVIAVESNVSDDPVKISDLTVRDGLTGIDVSTSRDAAPTTIERVESDHNTQDGGIWVEDQTPEVDVDAASIHDNHSDDNGGGFTMFCCATVSITNSEIYGNSADGDGGGAYPFEGDGVTFTGNDVHDNTAGRDGGGLYIDDGFGSPDVIANNRFEHNTASGVGGGAALYDDQTLFAGNLVAHNTGGGLDEGSDVAVLDSTIVDNHGTGLSGATQGAGSFSLVYNDIIGGNTTDIDPGTSACGAGSNAFGSPLPAFADSEFHLAAGSAAIGAGDNARVPSVLAEDADGAARIRDGTVDLGYVEFGSGAGSGGAWSAAPGSCDPSLGESAQGQVGPGSGGAANLTTDAEADGATASDPIETTMTPTVSASDRIEEHRPLASSAIDLGAWTVDTAVFQALPDAAYTIAFEIDSTLVGSASLSDLAVYDNGTAVPDCGTENPCIRSRTALPGGNVRLTVAATPTVEGSQGGGGHFSQDTWTFTGGRPVTLTNSSPPAVSGVPTEGATLTGSEGEWTGADGTQANADQWIRCAADGSGCASIDGATGTQYVAKSDDIGHTLRFEVAATDLRGTIVAESDPTAIVAAAEGSSGSSGSSGSGGASDSGGSSTPTAGSSGSGGAVPAEGPEPSDAASAAATPGSAGGVTAGTGPDAPSLTWPAGAFTEPATVSLETVPEGSTSPGFSIGSAEVALTVRAADGAPITSFSKPLEIVFSSMAAGAVPAYSEDGTTWTAMPQLATDSLPSGFVDGWFRTPADEVHVFTLHATDFALLAATAQVKEEFALGFSYPSRLTLHGKKPKRLTVTVTPSLPARLALVLRRASSVIAKRSVSLHSRRSIVSLVLPRTLRAGTYRLTAVAMAGRTSVDRVVTVHVSRG